MFKYQKKKKEKKNYQTTYKSRILVALLQYLTINQVTNINKLRQNS